MSSILIITNIVLLTMNVYMQLKCKSLANTIKEQKVKQSIITEFTESLIKSTDKNKPKTKHPLSNKIK